MKIIFREPKTGKTAELIKRCANNGGYIVCVDERRAKYTADMAKNMGEKIPFPLTFDEFLKRRYYEKGVKQVYIDNADLLIERIASGIRIDAIVMDDTEN